MAGGRATTPRLLEVLWMLNSSRKNPPASLPVIYSGKHGSDAAPPLLITGLISSCKRYHCVSACARSSHSGMTKGDGGLKGIIAPVENLGELESYPKMLQGCLTRGVIHQSDSSSPSVSHSSLPLPCPLCNAIIFPLAGCDIHKGCRWICSILPKFGMSFRGVFTAPDGPRRVTVILGPRLQLDCPLYARSLCFFFPSSLSRLTSISYLKIVQVMLAALPLEGLPIRSSGIDPDDLSKISR